jgi:uncharacterized protein with predicted RNA binding PUA domain
MLNHFKKLLGPLSKLNPNDKFYMIIDYLFGKGVSKVIPKDKLIYTYSRKTSKIKSVYYDRNLVATFRSDGGIALTLYGAELLKPSPNFIDNCLLIKEEAVESISNGKSVFAKHVVKCGSRVRPKSEVVVLDAKRNILAVGRAVLSWRMMEHLKSGVAVKVREGKNHKKYDFSYIPDIRNDERGPTNKKNA